MRKKLNAIRRRYQRTRNDNIMRETRKQQYLEEKRKYEAASRKSKTDSWKKYCKVTTSSDLWNAVYKLASGKIKNKSTLSTLKKLDDIGTTRMEDTVRFMIDFFTPRR